MKREGFNSLLHSGFLLAFRIWGSAWLAFLTALIPMYIWRGSYYENFDIKLIGENIIIAAVGIIAGFIILMLLHAKSDEAERLSDSEMWKTAGIAVGIYIAVWMLVWALWENNYLVACCGYHLEKLLGLNDHNRPTFSSAITSALIYGFVYFSAIVLGTKMAQKRRNKRNTH